MDKKVLVAYFSATGTTAKVAQKLAKAAGADLYEIKPKIPYNRADLDWNDKQSRSSVEMNTPSARPEIVDKVTHMEQYDVLFLGFPIWWYVAPVIINTFLESYDLSGKMIIPFATSGGSGIGKTNERLLKSCPDAALLSGKMLNAPQSEAELKLWVESLGL